MLEAAVITSLGGDREDVVGITSNILPEDIVLITGAGSLEICPTECTFLSLTVTVSDPVLLLLIVKPTVGSITSFSI